MMAAFAVSALESSTTWRAVGPSSTPWCATYCAPLTNAPRVSKRAANVAAYLSSLSCVMALFFLSIGYLELRELLAYLCIVGQVLSARDTERREKLGCR